MRLLSALQQANGWNGALGIQIQVIQRDDGVIISLDKNSRGGLYLTFLELEIDSRGRRHTSQSIGDFDMEAGN